MDTFLHNLVFRTLDTLSPGGGITLSEWEQFGSSMIWCAFVAAVLGWVAMIALTKFQLVNSPKSVWKLNRPYRSGIGVLWSTVVGWGIIYILATFGPLGKIRAFLHLNTFILLAAAGLLSWGIYAILASLACRWVTMRRYRYVTLMNRLLARRF